MKGGAQWLAKTATRFNHEMVLGNTSLELPIAVGSLECPLEGGEAQNLSCAHVLETAFSVPVFYHVRFHASQHR